MTRLLPRTLFGQMLLILLAGLLVSHLVGTLIYSFDRAQAVRMIGGYAAAQRIANLAQLIDEAPPEWRNRIVQAASDPTLRVTVSADPPAFAEADTDADFRPIRRYLADQLSPPLAARLHVDITETAPPFNGFPRHMAGGPGMPMGRPPWMAGAGPWQRLRAAVQLSDGQWLAFATALPNAPPATQWPFVAALASMAVIVILASIWAVRRVSAPLRLLAGAAERLGRDVNATPVAETGTAEMRQAAHSFNQMQARIRRLLENRTQMLAALSHDLRTPLTLLRLRTESLSETEDRDRMLSTIGDLEVMINASLSLARDQSAAEPWRRTDVVALVTALVDDMADAGLPVTMAPADPIELDCQTTALRRALTNLIDNAVKYGQTAHVMISATPATLRIDIDDQGPGIPAAELQRVFEPFYRLEQSRSRETGGTGLGLSIALSVVQAHDGELTLANRTSGGLRASVLLPR